MLEPQALRRRPLDTDASAAGQVGSPSTTRKRPAAASRNRRASAAEMAAILAEYRNSNGGRDKRPAYPPGCQCPDPACQSSREADMRALEPVRRRLALEGPKDGTHAAA